MNAMKKMSVTKVVGDQIHLVPRFSEVGGNASHGSHTVVAADDKDCLHLTVVCNK